MALFSLRTIHSCVMLDTFLPGYVNIYCRTQNNNFVHHFAGQSKARSNPESQAVSSTAGKCRVHWSTNISLTIVCLVETRNTQSPVLKVEVIIVSKC